MVFYHAKRRGNLIEEVQKYYDAESEALCRQYKYPWLLANLYILDIKQKPNKSILGFIGESGTQLPSLSVDRLLIWLKSKNPQSYQR